MASRDSRTVTGNSMRLILPAEVFDPFVGADEELSAPLPTDPFV